MDFKDFKEKWKSSFARDGNIFIRGHAHAFGLEDVTSLPSGIHAETRHSTDKDGNHVRDGGNVYISDLKAIESLPADIAADDSFDIHNCKSLKTIPESVNPSRQLGIRHCEAFEVFPAGKYKTAYIALEDLPKMAEVQPGLKSSGDLIIRRCHSLKSLENIDAWNCIAITECDSFRSLGENIRTGMLSIDNSPNFETLPSDIGQTVEVGLIIDSPKLRDLPSTNPNWELLDLAGCTALKSLPEQIVMKNPRARLHLQGCTDLEVMPHTVEAHDIDISRCPSIKAIESSLKAEYVNASQCVSLSKLPDGTHITGVLLLEGCKSLTELPAGMYVRGSLSLKNSGVRELPRDLTLGDGAWLNLYGCEGISIPAELLERFEQTGVRIAWPERYEVIPALTSHDAEPSLS